MRIDVVIGAVALALALGACGVGDVPTMTGPMMSPSVSAIAPRGEADDGAGMSGSMMGQATSDTAAPQHGPIAGEGLDAAAVAALQTAVDQGAQPWRLDPEMTAVAFVQGRYGWMMPRVERGAGNSVVVDDGAGGAVSLALAQPARTGAGGIWVVTGGTWLR